MGKSYENKDQDLVGYGKTEKEKLTYHKRHIEKPGECVTSGTD